VGEELVAETLALGGAGHQAGDVDELDHRRHHLLRLLDRRDRIEAPVGHRHDADVRLDGAERIVLGGDARLGERVEQGGLADVRQADDTALHFLRNKDFRNPGLSASLAGAASFFGAGAFFASAASFFFSGTSFFFSGSSFLAATGLSWLCSFCIAPCMSPARHSGSTSSELAMAASIASRSSAGALCST